MMKISFDPRVKFLLFIVTCFFAMNVQNFVALTAFTAFVSLLYGLSGKWLSTLKMFALYLIGIVLGLLAMNMQAGVLGTLIAVVSVMFRMFMPVVIAFALVFQTTKISEFLSAFQKIKAPPALYIPFAVFFRFIPTVQDEWRGIRQSMAFRGIGLSAGRILIHPIVSAEHILVPLMFSCVSIMDELVASSLARGLDSSKERNCYLDIKMKPFDYLVLLMTVGFAVLVFII